MKKKAEKVSTKAGTAKKDANKPSGKAKKMVIQKDFQRAKSTCKVTFRLPKDAAPGARSVHVAGDFNKWNVTETPMRKLSNGDFTLTMELPCDREYSFRYIIDANHWEKDWFADKHIPGDSEEDDSVIVL